MNCSCSRADFFFPAERRVRYRRCLHRSQLAQLLECRTCAFWCAFYVRFRHDRVFLSAGIINFVLGVMLIIASKRRDVSLLWPSIVVIYVKIGLAVRGGS